MMEQIFLFYVVRGRDVSNTSKLKTPPLLERRGKTI